MRAGQPMLIEPIQRAMKSRTITARPTERVLARSSMASEPLTSSSLVELSHHARENTIQCSNARPFGHRSFHAARYATGMSRAVWYDRLFYFIAEEHDEK